MSKYGAAGRIVAPYPTPWGHNHEKPGVTNRGGAVCVDLARGEQVPHSKPRHVRSSEFIDRNLRAICS